VATQSNVGFGASHSLGPITGPNLQDEADLQIKPDWTRWPRVTGTRRKSGWAGNGPEVRAFDR